MRSNDYLNMVNSQMKEASQWIKDYRANPEKYGSATTSTGSNSSGTSTNADLSQIQQLLGNSNNSMMGMFQSMMMLMMFQILAQQMGVKSTGNASDLSNIPSPYHPVQTGNCNTNTGGTTTSNDQSTTGSSSAANQTCVNTMSEALDSTDSPTEEDLQALIDDWQDKGLTETQFGQTVMYLLHQGDASTAEDLQNWLPSLFQSGTLNPNPLLNASYLDKLPDDRLAVLSDSLASTGLTYADGVPNTSLAGTLLRSIGEDSSATSSESTMAQDILYRLWQANPSDAVLGNVLSLAGFSSTDDGGLQGPFTLASKYATETV